MTPEEREAKIEAETIKCALEGDRECGREALVLCRIGLDHGTLSRRLAAYLAERLVGINQALAEADKLRESKKSSGSIRSARDAAIAEALLIKRPAIKPRDPFPDWEQQYAAYGTLLLKAGMRPEEVKKAMSEARRTLEPNRTPRKKGTMPGDMDGLDRSNAGKILEKYESLLTIDDGDLRRMAGDLRQLVPTVLPQSKKG